MTAIFISHSSADNAAAAEMKRWLEAQGHTSLFLDFDPEAGIKAGSLGITVGYPNILWSMNPYYPQEHSYDYSH
jgi:hypothetical protein